MIQLVSSQAETSPLQELPEIFAAYNIYDFLMRNDGRWPALSIIVGVFD
jgi:hypothetical protein